MYLTNSIVHFAPSEGTKREHASRHAQHPAMREWVAHNKTIPEEIIGILAQDINTSVRYHIASKRKTPVDVLVNLAKDEDESIRLAVARNKKATKEVLMTLLADDWEEIVEVVKKRLDE